MLTHNTSKYQHRTQIDTHTLYILKAALVRTYLIKDYQDFPNFFNNEFVQSNLTLSQEKHTARVRRQIKTLVEFRFRVTCCLLQKKHIINTEHSVYDISSKKVYNGDDGS